MRISDWSSDVCSSDLVARPCVASFWRGRYYGRHCFVFRGAAKPGRTDEMLLWFSYAVAARSSRNDRNRADVERRAERGGRPHHAGRSEEHTSELQSLMRNSYAVFCLKKKHLIHNSSNHSHEQYIL